MKSRDKYANRNKVGDFFRKAPTKIAEKTKMPKLKMRDNQAEQVENETLNEKESMKTSEKGIKKLGSFFVKAPSAIKAKTESSYKQAGVKFRKSESIEERQEK